MNQMLAGLVPGLPDDLAAQIRRGAEGVPLYAVETVRMLLDRGLVAQDGPHYVVTGDVADLEVPETLHALVAARLDGLETAERQLLQEAAVIGQSFTPATLTAVASCSAADVQRLLDGLVDKQVLAFVDDALSAERGQYAFLQALLRTVALGTLGRRERKARHLAVARHLEEEGGDISEVLASHYLEAVAADPDAADVPALRAAACQTLEAAGRRAISLALGPEARRHFEGAAELAEQLGLRGRLLREAGMAAHLSGELEESLALLTNAADLLREGGLPREAARAEGLAGNVLVEAGRIDDAALLLARAYVAVDDGSDDEAVADLAARRARVAFMRGDRDEVLGFADHALRIADGRRLWPILVDALITKGNALGEVGRPVEASALLTHAVQLADEQELAASAMRAYYNLAELMMGSARFAEGEALLERGLTLARRRGDRQGERMLLGQGVLILVASGRWDEAIARIWALNEQPDDIWAAQSLSLLPHVLVARGDRSGLSALVDQLAAKSGWSEMELTNQGGRALILRETGRAEEAVREACDALLPTLDTGLSHIPLQFGEAVETAFMAGDPAAVEALLDRIDQLQPAQLIPLLEAEAARARARLAAHRGELEAADRWFRRGLELLSDLETPFAMARVQLEYAELLLRAGYDANEAESLRDAAASVFERLGAEPWLARARALGAAVAA
jgi:tetratricopeptide (TPR) repeat protein